MSVRQESMLPASHGAILHLAPEVIDVPCLARRNVVNEERLAALAASIRAGTRVLSPLTVRPSAGGRYELIAGYRRLLAVQRAGLRTVPALVMQESDGDAITRVLVEATCSESRTVLEVAWAMVGLQDHLRAEGRPASQRVLRLITGAERATVSEALTMGRALPLELLRERTRDGELLARLVALPRRALLPIARLPAGEPREELLGQVIAALEDGSTGAEIVRLVQRAREESGGEERDRRSERGRGDDTRKPVHDPALHAPSTPGYPAGAAHAWALALLYLTLLMRACGGATAAPGGSPAPAGVRLANPWLRLRAMFADRWRRALARCRGALRRAYAVLRRSRAGPG